MSLNDKSKLIVIVEDEETILSVMKIRLEHEGFEVKTARDGAEGLRLIKKEHPDLVLLDMLLPSMGGFEIMEALRKENILPKLPIIVISNSGQPVEVERIKRLGVKDYLIKVNFSLQEVVEKVQGFFKKEKSDPNVRQSDSSGYVLIVDDDLVLAGLLKGELLKQGFGVSIAGSGADAKKILETTSPIDIILLDIVLPDTDGFAFLKELKSNASFKSIPVMIVSNLGQKEEIATGMKLGALDYMVKADTFPNKIAQRAKEIVLSNKTPNLP